MSHMVIFRSTEGKAGYHQTDSLDEAVGYVEHLRNQEQVPDARIFRMEEIPIAVKTYYKVEVTPAPPATPTASPASAPPPAPAVATATPSAPPTPAPSAAARPPAPVPLAGEDVPVVEPMAPAGGANGARFGRFNRS